MARQGETLLAAVAQGRRQRLEQQRRGRLRRVALVSGLFALVLALAIPVVGYYVVFLRPLRQTALVVNDVAYSWGDYLTRTRMLIAQAQALGAWQPESLNSLIFDVLEELERQEIIRQYAPQEGLTVAPQELQREIRVRVLGQAAAEDSSIPESEFQERYRRRLALLKVTAREFETIAEAGVLRRTFEEHLKGKVPTEALHRHLFGIQVSDLEQARTILDRLRSGEEFSSVARALSRDPAAQESDGDLGWFPQGAKEEFDSLLFTLGDGEVHGDPVIAQTGVYVLQAVGAPEVRPTSSQHYATLQTRALNDWLLQRRTELAAAGTLRRPGGGISTSRYNWVLSQLSQDRELFPRAGTGG